MELGIQQEQVMNIKQEQQVLPMDSEGNVLGALQNNNYFNDMLSPFFAPYGIDVSHFPLTNPPIFESAMMMNGQGQLRRRISISNGQIGQITNHSPDDIYDHSPVKSQDDMFNNGLAATNGLVQSQPQSQPQPHPLPQQLQPEMQPIPVSQSMVVPSVPISVPQTMHQLPLAPQAQARPRTHPHQPSQQIATNSNGVPTQKLLYNNEVIFNPEAGPIPGTAAWKKARLLERNRIAASKCRQRKKAAQNQLKEDVEKYSKEIEDLTEENDSLKMQLAAVRAYATSKGLDELLELCEEWKITDK
jgi:hypothetical protein